MAQHGLNIQWRCCETIGAFDFFSFSAGDHRRPLEILVELNHRPQLIVPASMRSLRYLHFAKFWKVFCETSLMSGKTYICFTVPWSE